MTLFRPGHSPPQVTIPTRVLDGSKKILRRGPPASKPGSDSTEDELRAYCRERLAPYKVPARVEFRKELPKTMVGKVLRRVLKDEINRPQQP